MNDLSGRKFGKLIVVEQNGYIRKEIAWRCICECGNEKTINAYALTSGHTKSCGCARKKASKAANTKHGLYGTKIYNTYYNMKNRCYNPNYCLFSHYGGKGITICNEWLGKHGVEAFFKWSMSHGYAENLSIDRINNDKGYSPNNCRWVTMKEQQNNRTNNRYITIDGVTKTMMQWAEFTGIKYSHLQEQLKKGTPPKEALCL